MNSMKNFIKLKVGNRLRYVNMEHVSEVSVENKSVISDEGQVTVVYVHIYFQGHKKEDAVELTGEQAKLFLQHIEAVASALRPEESGENVKLV